MGNELVPAHTFDVITGLSEPSSDLMYQAAGPREPGITVSSREMEEGHDRYFDLRFCCQVMNMELSDLASF
jgi:hypothetical protein